MRQLRDDTVMKVHAHKDGDGSYVEGVERENEDDTNDVPNDPIR